MRSNSVKKFRSSAAPKGTKLGSGYQDRTVLRTSAEEDEKATRIKSLEEMVKLGQMDIATFETLRDKIIGGNVKDVHLVKGLDWKLLERVKKGEDVLDDNDQPANELSTGNSPSVDVEKELEMMEGKEIQPIAKPEKSKKGQMAPPPSVAGTKRSRDEILRELKASRLAMAEREKQAQHPSLGPKFTKFGEKKEKSRIEKDERGREILITVDNDGRVKRKVRRAKPEDHLLHHGGLLMPDKDAKPLGMDITPIAPVAPDDDGNGDIFEGVGNDYNPLGDMEEDESDDSSLSSEPAGSFDHTRMEALDQQNPDTEPAQQTPSNAHPPRTPSPMSPHQTSPKRRNYFGESTVESEDLDRRSNSLQDPTILAALKKASIIHPLSSGMASENKAEAATVARRKAMLESHDRDADDLDMGFGGSRFEDGEDGDDGTVKLSAWHPDDKGGDDGGKGKGRRKRGRKKRKGDPNSAADVLQVMERKKGEV